MTATPDRLSAIRAELEADLEKVDGQIEALRARRLEINADIKERTKARTELTSAISKLTPRTRKPKAEPVIEDVAAEEEPAEG